MVNVISFPALGITMSVDTVAFHIGPKPIYWYAIAILTGFILAVIFCMRSAKKRGINSDYVFDIALYGLVIGIICARIYYVIFDWDSFKDSPLDIFKVWEGGLAIYGGIIGGILTAFVYCRIKKQNILEMFDICAPGLLIGQAVGRYGNFLNAEVFGKKTDCFLGMSINGAAPVHPLFLYESMWNILGLILIIIFRDRKKADGQVFFGYLLWYSCGRIILEGMRQPEYILYAVKDVVGISQIVAGILIIISILMLFRLKKRSDNFEEALETEEEK
ncbi:MAG: prolipoprotein diacylglyceryl transferase [Clostridia bacterium]|nr:prolipoprotein diacylglyceryl transferase [Clostridia bacterium]